MAERLKVFQDDINITDATHDIITTTSSSQAVVKNIAYSIKADTYYDINFNIKYGNLPIVELQKPFGDTNDSYISLTGSQIIDTDSNLSVTVVRQLLDKKYMPDLIFNVFYYGDDYVLKNSNNRATLTAYSFEDLDEAERDTSTNLFNNVYAAATDSVLIDGTWYYIAFYNGYVKRYNIDDGSEAETYPQLSKTNGNITTDNTYIYFKNTDNANTLERIEISSGNLDTVTLSDNCDVSSTGVFTYYDGKIYSIYYAYLQIIDTTTWEVESLTAFDGEPQDIIGHRLTIANNGVPYIVFADNYLGNGFALNLETREKLYIKDIITSTSSTTYIANASIELSSGVVGFVYLSHFSVLSVNNNKLELLFKSTDYNPPLWESSDNYTSVAQIPIHKVVENLDVIPVDYSYNIYADGIEITEVN